VGLPTQLTSLAVNDNNLTGAALSDLAALTRLRRLDLAGKPACAGCWLMALQRRGWQQGLRRLACSSGRFAVCNVAVGGVGWLAGYCSWWGRMAWA
jgi:hypothetical protein